MAMASKSELVVIGHDRIAEASQFLNANLNPAISFEEWVRIVRSPWSATRNDFGCALVRPDIGMVGVIIAYWSEQDVDGRPEQFCNLGHWCVLPEHRRESLRLIRRYMAFKDVTLTGFSSIRRVVKVLTKLGWDTLDDHVYVVPNVLGWGRGRRVEVVTAYDEILDMVDDRHRRILKDHAEAKSASYLLATDGTEWCLSIRKVEKRRGVKFSIPIYVSDLALFRRWLGTFLRGFRSLDGAWAMLCQARFLPTPPKLALRLPEPRPHIYRAATVMPERITCLYSELLR